MKINSLHNFSPLVFERSAGSLLAVSWFFGDLFLIIKSLLHGIFTNCPSLVPVVGVPPQAACKPLGQWGLKMLLVISDSGTAVLQLCPKRLWPLFAAASKLTRTSPLQERSEVKTMLRESNLLAFNFVDEGKWDSAVGNAMKFVMSSASLTYETLVKGNPVEVANLYGSPNPLKDGVLSWLSRDKSGRPCRPSRLYACDKMSQGHQRTIAGAWGKKDHKTVEADEENEVVDGKRPCQHANLEHHSVQRLQGRAKRMSLVCFCCARSRAVNHVELCTNETPATPFMTIYRYIDDPDDYRFYYDTW